MPRTAKLKLEFGGPTRNVGLVLPLPVISYIESAAAMRLTTKSEYIRQAVVARLQRDGVLPVHRTDDPVAA